MGNDYDTPIEARPVPKLRRMGDWGEEELAKPVEYLLPSFACSRMASSLIIVCHTLSCAQFTGIISMEYYVYSKANTFRPFAKKAGVDSKTKQYEHECGGHCELVVMWLMTGRSR